MSTTATRINLEIRAVSTPVSEAGWYLCFGYGEKPLVLYGTRGQTTWRQGCRFIPITGYAGPIPDGEPPRAAATQSSRRATR